MDQLQEKIRSELAAMQSAIDEMVVQEAFPEE
jgi:hypothetical protein